MKFKSRIRHNRFLGIRLPNVRLFMLWALLTVVGVFVLAWAVYDTLLETGHIEVVRSVNEGDIFVGHWLHGKPYGEGKLVTKMGNTYEGTWNSDGDLVMGVLTTPQYVYTGEFKDYQPDGYGECQFKGGAVYRGFWKDGLESGLGKMIERDGTLLFGYWENGTLPTPKGADYVVGEKVYGIDVSKYQKIIDWRRLRLPANKDGEVYANLRKSGVVRKVTTPYIQPVLFAVMKSTEGGTIQDPTFEINYEEARLNGYIRGAYHFLSPYSSVAEQVQNYIQSTPLEPGDLPPILDIEISNRVMKRQHAKICKMALQWLKEIESYYGVKPIIYTYNSYYNSYMKGKGFDDYDYWIARYSDEEPSARKWEIWQFTENGRCGGISTPVDVDIFKGDFSSLRTFVKRGGIKPHIGTLINDSEYKYKEIWDVKSDSRNYVDAPIWD